MQRTCSIIRRPLEEGKDAIDEIQCKLFPPTRQHYKDKLGVGSVIEKQFFTFYFVLLPHTVIEITNNVGKVEKRSGEET